MYPILSILFFLLVSLEGTTMNGQHFAKLELRIAISFPFVFFSTRGYASLFSLCSVFPFRSSGPGDHQSPSSFADSSPSGTSPRFFFLRIPETWAKIPCLMAWFLFCFCFDVISCNIWACTNNRAIIQRGPVSYQSKK